MNKRNTFWQEIKPFAWTYFIAIMFFVTTVASKPSERMEIIGLWIVAVLIKIWQEIIELTKK